MNVYTGDIFLDNARYFYFNKKLEYINRISIDNRIVACLSTFYPEKYYKNNKFSILKERYDVINWGYQNGYVKIWGKGWGSKAEGNSRNNRANTKGDILGKFHFALCFENTLADYYVTERLWESIHYGCLPIYYSNNTIYQDFPRDSFIDYRDFNNSGELFKYINGMTTEEWISRMNKCIKVFNKFVDKYDKNKFLTCENKNLETINYYDGFQLFIKKIREIHF
jgi:hypothetical protein